MVCHCKMESPKRKFVVTIIGGGLGGLTLAIGLLRRGLEVRIYEASDDFRETGLGLNIGPAAHRSLRLIAADIRDLYDSLVTTHADSPGFEHLRLQWIEIVRGYGDEESNGKTVMQLDALPSGFSSLRRGDFLSGLVKLLPEGVAQLNKRLMNLEDIGSEGIELHFEDGTTEIADMVLGCDGIKSKVKEAIFPGEAQSGYSGMYCYRAVAKMEDMVKVAGDQRARTATWYYAPGRYAIHYPINRATEVNIGLYIQRPKWEHPTWINQASREEMMSDFGGLCDPVPAIINIMPSPAQWANFELPPLKSYCKSAVAILGDAAHASTPHQGAGAGQAIEDAYVLVELLSDPRVVDREDVICALKAYDAVRRPRSQEVVRTSAENAELLCLTYPGIAEDEERLFQLWRERFHWLWNIDMEQHANEARTIMHGLMDEKC